MTGSQRGSKANPAAGGGLPPTEIPERQARRAAALAQGASDAVLIIDKDLVVVWGNDAARETFEGGGEGLVGRHCWGVIHGRRRPCDPLEEECPIATLRVSGQPEACQKVLVDADGNREPCTIKVHPVQGPDGEPVEYVLTRRESRTSDELWRIVQQQSDDLALTHTLTEKANRGCSPDELLEAVAEGTRAAFGSQSACVYLLDAHRERLDMQPPRLTAGMKASIERIIRSPLPDVIVPLERAPRLMAALHSKEPTTFAGREDILEMMAEHTDSPFIRGGLSSILRVLGVDSIVTLPLRRGTGVIGLLSVGRKGAYSAAETRRLERLSDQVAGVIVKRQLQEDHQRLLRRQALLLQAAAEGILGLNRDAEIVFANKAAASLTGRSQVQLQGLSFHEVCGVCRKAERQRCDGCAVAGALADRRPRYDVESSIVALDDEPRPVRLSAVPLNEPELSLVITIQDITEQVHHQAAEKKATERLRRSFSGTVAALRRLAERRDPYTAGHERRVAALARAIAQHMDLDEEVVDAIRLAATIHDIGKHAIPVEILTKPGRLSAQEMQLIRTHSMVGWEILSEAEFPEPIATVVRQHHERLDGSGYPDGISGDGITMEARVIAVADTVEAMASHRPYRASLGLEDALFEIQRRKGTHFDPRVVSSCVHLFRSDSFAFE